MLEQSLAWFLIIIQLPVAPVSATTFSGEEDFGIEALSLDLFWIKYGSIYPSWPGFLWVDPGEFVRASSHIIWKSRFILVGRTFLLVVFTLVGTSSTSMVIPSLLYLYFRFAVSIGSSVSLVVVHLCLERFENFHEELHFGLGWVYICFLLGWYIELIFRASIYLWISNYASKFASYCFLVSIYWRTCSKMFAWLVYPCWAVVSAGRAFL